MPKTMGIYCRAYLAEQFAQYSMWKEKVKADVELSSGDQILYLHDNYTVTGSVFKDDAIILDDVDPEWVSFCRSELEFLIPEDVLTANSQSQAEVEQFESREGVNK